MLAGDSISNNGGLTKREIPTVNDTGTRLNKSGLREKRVSIAHQETAPEADVSMFKVPEDSVVENNTDKSIDFNAQLQALKKRTESELPHTLS